MMKKSTLRTNLFHITICLTLLISTKSKILMLTFYQGEIPSENIACAHRKYQIDELILYADTDRSKSNQCILCANLTEAAQIIGHLPMISINVEYSQITASRLAQKFATGISLSSYAELVWLHPTFTVSCAYLTEFVQTFVSLTNKKIGIQTYQEWWTYYMGGRFGCPQFGNYPLLYRYYLGEPFRPFGGWTYASLYQEQGIFDADCNNLRETFLHT